MRKKEGKERKRKGGVEGVGRRRKPPRGEK